MDKNGFALEFFAAKLRPDESEKKPHEKDNDRFGGVGGNGSNRNGRGGDESTHVGELLDCANDTINEDWAKDFVVTFGT